MVKLSKFRIDTKAATEGVWVEWLGGIELLIAKSGNPEFTAFIQKLRAESKDGEFNTDIDSEGMKLCAAHTLLRGWRNVDDDETGEPSEYSPEKGYKAFCDPELQDLYRFVLVESNLRERYLVEAVRGTVKN